MKVCKCRVGLKLFYFDQFFFWLKGLHVSSSCKSNDECCYIFVHMYNIAMIQMAFTIILLYKHYFAKVLL